MTAPRATACPFCAAPLAISAGEQAGTTVTCQTCHKTVALETLSGASSTAEAAIISVETLAPIQQTNVSHKTGQFDHRKSSRIVLVSVCLFGVVGLGLLAWLFVDRIANREADRFAWLPAQAEVIVYVRPADLLKSPFVQWTMDSSQSREQVNQGLEKLRTDVGFGLEEIESITVGIKNAGDLTAAMDGIIPGQMPNPVQLLMNLSQIGQKEIVGVIRFSLAVDLPQTNNFQQRTEPVTYQNVTYYRDRTAAGQSPSGFVYCPSPDVLVVSGREDVLRELIDQRGRTIPHAELKIFDPQQHVAVTFLMDPALAKSIPEDAVGPSHDVTVFRKVQSASIAVKATEGLEFTIRQNCPDVTVAETLLASTTALVARGQLQYRDALPQLPKNLGDVTDALLASTRSTRQGNVVETQGSLPESTRDQLKAIPGELFAAMLGSNHEGDEDHPIRLGPSAKGFYATENKEEFRGDAVLVKSLPGLPEGLLLRGRAGWMRDPIFKKEGEILPPRLMVFDIEYGGEIAGKAVEFGNIQLKHVAVEPSQYLKLTENPKLNGNQNPFHGFFDLRDKSSLDLDSPSDCIQIRLHFEHPTIEPTHFSAVEGQVTLKVATETKTILVPDFAEQAGQPPTDPDLKAAGFTVISKKDEQGKTSWDVKFAPGTKIDDLRFVRADGKKLAAAPFVVKWDHNGGPGYMVMPTGDAPVGMAAKVMLHTRFEEVVVPFRFQNVPLPKSPDQPFIPGILWQLSNAKPLPAGISVDGCLRWKDKSGLESSPEPILTLAVDVTGPAMRNAIATGFMTLHAAKTDTGAEVEVASATSSKDYWPIGRNYIAQHAPPDGKMLMFELKNSPVPFQALKTATGSLKILTAAQTKKTKIERFPSQIGKPLSNPEFEAVGLDFQFERKEEQIDFTLTKGEGLAVGGVKLIRKNGDDGTLIFDSYHPDSKQGSIRPGEYQLQPDDALEITYYLGLKELEIPFAFENLPIPPLPPK